MTKDMLNTSAHDVDHPDGCPHQPMADGPDALSASPADTFTRGSDAVGQTQEEQAMMNDEPTLFECEECGTEYNPDEEGADGMCEDCYDDTFENYGADDDI